MRSVAASDEGLNQYQVEAMAELLDVMGKLPQAKKLRFECRGIVGGDFDVIVEKKFSAPHQRDRFFARLIKRQGGITEGPDV